jgi:hypothetical protein
MWLVDFHDRLLRGAGLHVFDARPEAFSKLASACLQSGPVGRAKAWLAGRFEFGSNIVLADSRIAGMTPLWENAAAELDAGCRVLVMLRHPAHTVASRDLREIAELTPTNRAAAWLNTQLATEFRTRQSSRTYVSYDRLRADWTSTVTLVDAQLSLPPVRVAGKVGLMNAERAIAAAPSGATRSWTELGVAPAIADVADRVWMTFSESEDAGGADPKFDLRFDDLRAEYLALHRSAAGLVQSSTIAATRRVRPA